MQIAVRLVMFFYISFILANIQFHILTNILLEVGMPHSCTGTFSKKKGGLQVLAGLAPYIQTVGSLLRNSLAGEMI